MNSTNDYPPAADQLDTYDNPKPDRPYLNEIICPEFTSMCPKTGHPDFGTVTYTYVAGDRCVELKALKLYLHRFRHVGEFYESVCNRLLDDFVKACSPVWCEVKIELTPRGGIRSNIVCTHGRKPEL
jgi:7-cyano-7-deazaguanine reductase